MCGVCVVCVCGVCVWCVCGVCVWCVWCVCVCVCVCAWPSHRLPLWTIYQTAQIPSSAASSPVGTNSDTNLNNEEICVLVNEPSGVSQYQ